MGEPSDEDREKARHLAELLAGMSPECQIITRMGFALVDNAAQVTFTADEVKLIFRIWRDVRRETYESAADVIAARLVELGPKRTGDAVHELRMMHRRILAKQPPKEKR
jgi:hypothetical protein